jgi:hypothetical protein
MTGMYNVVEKLRSGEPLTKKERKVHEVAACGVLRDLHDELDRLVAARTDGRGRWSARRSSRLVGLHDERVEEEKRGRSGGCGRSIRSRASHPRPRRRPELGLEETAAMGRSRRSRSSSGPPTRSTSSGRSATRSPIGPLTPDLAAGGFRGARRDLVARHLEALDTIGAISADPDGHYHLAAAY